MLPWPPELGLAPCQAPPLLVTDAGEFLVETSDGRLVAIKSLTWNDLKVEEHDLFASGIRTRLSSPRCVGLLKRAKERGLTPEAAIRQAWKLALSPVRAGREWRRWQLVR